VTFEPGDAPAEQRIFSDELPGIAAHLLEVVFLEQGENVFTGNFRFHPGRGSRAI